MPTLGLILVLWFNVPNIFLIVEITQLSILVAVVFFCTALVPLFWSWSLVKLGMVTSLVEPTDNDRKQLMAFTELFFLLAYYVLHNIPLEAKALTYYILGVNVAMIATLLTSLVTKVSLHAVGIGGILGTIIGMMYYTRVQMLPQVAIAIALVYLVGFSRYKLKAHNGGDIFIGNIIGISCQALVFFVGAR